MRHLLNLSLLSAALFSAALLPSCAIDEGKGAEDDEFGVYEDKSDSFRNPTEHGSLIFDTPQAARLSSEEKFHSWDFELSDDAQVVLETALVTANLDTVMYLYKKNPDTGNFGRFKFKNDDASDGTVASALSKNLNKGQYRILVKGFKSSLRGRFDVVASCEGAGCKTSSCDIETFIGLQSFSNNSCGELFSTALNTEAVSRSNATVSLAQRCGLPDFASTAVEYYVDYFGGEDSFNDSFDFGGDVEVEVDWEVYKNGTTYVSVDGGGDEAALDFLVDGSGQVIAHYQHNQSPDHTLYCDGGDEFLENGDCFFDYVAAFPHAASDEVTKDTKIDASDAAAKLGPAALLAYELYASELGLSAAKDVEVTATTWDRDESVGSISLKASGQSRFVYELASTESNWQFTVKRGSSKRSYVCEEI